MYKFRTEPSSKLRQIFDILNQTGSFAEIGTNLIFRQLGFQTFGLLEIQPNCLKSKLTTPTIMQHLNAIIIALQVDGGIPRCIMLYYYPVLFQCLKSEL